MSLLSLVKTLNLTKNVNKTIFITNNVMRHSTSSSSCGGGDKSKKTELKKEKKKTPVGRFDDEFDDAPKPFDEKEPLKPWPNNTNPNTGEVNGPKGPEPTRYGDWERKGRCTDF